MQCCNEPTNYLRGLRLEPAPGMDDGGGSGFSLVSTSRRELLIAWRVLRRGGSRACSNSPASTLFPRPAAVRGTFCGGLSAAADDDPARSSSELPVRPRLDDSRDIWPGGSMGGTATERVSTCSEGGSERRAYPVRRRDQRARAEGSSRDSSAREAARRGWGSECKTRANHATIPACADQ